MGGLDDRPRAGDPPGERGPGGRADERVVRAVDEERGRGDLVQAAVERSRAQAGRRLPLGGAGVTRGAGVTDGRHRVRPVLVERAVRRGQQPGQVDERADRTLVGGGVPNPGESREGAEPHVPQRVPTPHRAAHRRCHGPDRAGVQDRCGEREPAAHRGAAQVGGFPAERVEDGRAVADHVVNRVRRWGPRAAQQHHERALRHRRGEVGGQPGVAVVEAGDVEAARGQPSRTWRRTRGGGWPRCSTGCGCRCWSARSPTRTRSPWWSGT